MAPQIRVLCPSQFNSFASNATRGISLLHTLAILKYDLIQKKALIFVNTIDAGFRLKLFLEQFGIRSAVLNGELHRIHVSIFSSSSMSAL